MSRILPLDKEAALRKMLSPDWQKKKPRSQQEVTCVECGKKRMINKGAVMPLRCKACALNHGWGKKP